jgi:threonine/homoserine/homoserine lactone efflux protein
VFEIILFLTSVFVVSFSGAIAPGPVTATTITLGTRQKYAGTMLAIGHGIIEIPLVLLIVSGLGKFLSATPSKIAIGFAGGLVLLFMGYSMLRDARKDGGYTCSNASAKAPVIAGIVLSASNPYFLIWWITVGIKFATDAVAYSWVVFAMFLFVHWLADLVWFQALSFASYKGAEIMSKRNLKIVLSTCALALMIFGVYFLYDAARTVAIL